MAPKDDTDHLSTDDAERLLRAGRASQIAEWNCVHRRGKHPLNWSHQMREGEKRRGLTLIPDNRLNLHDVQLLNLNFGPVVAIARCDATGGLIDSLQAEQVHLQNCTFTRCTFQNIGWKRAEIIACTFIGCTFIDCDLTESDLTHSRFLRFDRDTTCTLQDVTLHGAVLEGTRIEHASLRRCTFDLCIPNSHTLLDFSVVDEKSTFVGFPFAAARITPRTRSRMVRAIRRDYWKIILAEESLLRRWAWSLFWQITGFGFSLRNLIATFAIVIIAFTVLVRGASTVEAFKVSNEISELTLTQSLYFSIVTMTTLGYGDISPTDGSLLGYTLVTFMVTAGYVVMGALVARLVISAQWPE